MSFFLLTSQMCQLFVCHPVVEYGASLWDSMFSQQWRDMSHSSGL